MSAIDVLRSFASAMRTLTDDRDRMKARIAELEAELSATRRDAAFRRAIDRWLMDPDAAERCLSHDGTGLWWAVEIPGTAEVSVCGTDHESLCAALGIEVEGG